LKDYRQAVGEALQKSGHQVIGMEDDAASDVRPVAACLGEIRQRADLYVGLFAFRYGMIPPPKDLQACPHTRDRAEWQGLSITEL
jgi:hypothetical protein